MNKKMKGWLLVFYVTTWIHIGVAALVTPIYFIDIYFKFVFKSYYADLLTVYLGISSGSIVLKIIYELKKPRSNGINIIVDMLGLFIINEFIYAGVAEYLYSERHIGDGATGILGGIIWGAIWMVYFKKSRQAKAYFEIG